VRALTIIFHALGTATTLAAFGLETLVFYDIITTGYFIATERNPLILAIEVSFAIFGVGYSAYILRKIVESMKRR